MLLVDASVHVWARDRDAHPWRPTEQDPPHAAHDAAPELLEVQLAGAGAAGAILVQPSIYGGDHSFLGEVVRAGAGRYAGIARWDPHVPEVKAAVERDLDRHGLAGVRLSAEHDPDHHPWFEDGAGEAAWATAARRRQAISVLCRPSHLGSVAAWAGRCPEVRLVVDHLGLLRAGDDPRPLLDLVASAPNVGVRASALAALSGEPWPYRDLWPLLRELFAVAGGHRICYGTDWPFVDDRTSYDGTIRALDEALAWDDHDRGAVLGGNAIVWWGMDQEALARSGVAVR